MKYIDAEKLKAEINRLKYNAELGQNEAQGISSLTYNIHLAEELLCSKLLNFIDAIPEQPVGGLELKSLRPKSSSQSNTNHTVWHNASEEKPTKLPIIHIWYHGNRVDAVTHEDTCLQAELDDINFQPDDKWAYVEDLLNVQPHWKPSKEQIDLLRKVYSFIWADPATPAEYQDGLGDFIEQLKTL